MVDIGQFLEVELLCYQSDPDCVPIAETGVVIE